MSLSRRQILQASLLGGALGTFGRLAPPEKAAALRAAAPRGPATLDSYALMRDAVRYGRRLSFGPSLAHADTSADEAAIITIKVMNHIHTPLCFKLGNGPYTGGVEMVPMADRFSNPATLALLNAKGLQQLSDLPRFGALRMNKWWADILSTGRVEADGGGSAVPTGLTAADIGAFPADVAIQAALGVSQTDLSLNHSFKNCVLPASTDPNKGGDLGYHCAKQELITSPLGLVCFNMGVVCETTDAIGDVPNRVVTNDQVTVAALGRGVDAYIRILGQAVGLGLVDEALVAEFDKFVKSDSKIAEELQKNRGALRDALAAMGPVATLENVRHEMPNVAGAANFQLIGAAANQTAKAEFLAQCKFVKQALEIPGKPFRNFNLFLHMVDLDGAALDTTSAQGGSVTQAANPYCYVEGMRQLAVGLNMLAKVISQHKNVYVVVVSEGGRAATRGDDKASHAIVMGPGGPGNLKDFLYASQASVTSTTDPFVADPNQGNGEEDGSGQRFPDGNVVLSEANMPVEEMMTVGALLNGVVRHLETKKGVESTTGGLGKYVKIQTA